MEKLIKITPPIEFIGKSIREFLQSLHVGKKTIYEYSSNQCFYIEDKIVNSEYRLKPNQSIKIKLIEDKDNNIINQPIEVIYENDDYIIVNKPSDLLVHDDGNAVDNLLDRVRNYFIDYNYPYPVLPAHRIDKETSGIVVFAKHFISLAYLSNLFEKREVTKIYSALVEGAIKKREGVIDLKTMFDRVQDKMIISRRGVDTYTKYKLIEVRENQSLLDVSINTGRTHQIRVHLSSIGHPVVGDPIYGNSSDRLYLHFKQVEFIDFRTKEKLQFNSEVPFIK